MWNIEEAKILYGRFLGVFRLCPHLVIPVLEGIEYTCHICDKTFIVESIYEEKNGEIYCKPRIREKKSRSFYHKRLY